MGRRRQSASDAQIMISRGGIRNIRVKSGYVGAGVKTEASSVATWAHGADVAILSTVETLGATVGRVIECEGPGAWR
jgi:hypothetical protein